METFDEEELIERPLAVGSLIPHVRLKNEDYSSLRQYLAQKCYSLGKSVSFDLSHSSDKITVSITGEAN